jgi:predicted kinase
VTGARLVLICGLPGAGKTTLAKQLARELRAVRLCPDEWKHALGQDYYDEPGRVRLERKLRQLADELLDLGLPVILENGFWAREERDELRSAARARGIPVELRYLDASVDDLWRRLEVRNALGHPGTVPIARVDLERWAGQFEAPDAAELVLFDAATRRSGN